MSGATTERVPTDRPGEEGNGGMTYTARAAGSQSTRSTRMPGVMPRTGGRGAGEGGQNPKGAMEVVACNGYLGHPFGKSGAPMGHGG